MDERAVEQYVIHFWQDESIEEARLGLQFGRQRRLSKGSNEDFPLNKQVIQQRARVQEEVQRADHPAPSTTSNVARRRRKRCSRLAARRTAAVVVVAPWLERWRARRQQRRGDRLDGVVVAGPQRHRPRGVIECGEQALSDRGAKQAPAAAGYGYGSGGGVGGRASMLMGSPLHSHMRGTVGGGTNGVPAVATPNMISPNSMALMAHAKGYV
eukprot:gene20538-15069_t